MKDTVQANPAESTESQPGQVLAQRKQAPEPAADFPEDHAIQMTSLHLMDLARSSLLTHQEEIDLARQIEAGKVAQDQLLSTTDPVQRLQLEQKLSKWM